MATTHFTSAAAVLLAALAATTTTTHAAAVSRRNIVGSCPFAPISAGQQCYLKTLTGEVTNHEGCCDRGLTCQEAAGVMIEYKKTCQRPTPNGPPQQGSTCTTRDKPYIQTTQHCGREIVVTKCHCDTAGDATAVDGIWQCAVAGLPVCKYNACADKKAGDSCTLCAPWDQDCRETMVLRTCSDGGVCKPGGGGGGPVTIMPPVDEQCALIKCKDGYTCIPGKGCVKVKPTEASADKCPLVACQEGYKCNSKNGRCFKPKPKPCMDRNTAFCAKKLPDTFSDRRIANVCKRKNVARKCQLSCGICTKL